MQHTERNFNQTKSSYNGDNPKMLIRNLQSCFSFNIEKPLLKQEDGISVANVLDFDIVVSEL